MLKLPNCLFACLILSLATCSYNVVSADVVFDSSFTSPEFTDGQILFGGVNPDSIVGQGGFTISDSAGVGILNGGSGFQRALFGFDGSDNFDQALIEGMAAGSTIELTATGLNFAPTAANVGVLGFANIDDGNILGNSNQTGGVQFTWDGTSLFLDRNSNFTPTFDVDTGIGSGESFDYRQVHTANGDGSFEIEHFINGTLLTTTSGSTPNFDKSSDDVSGLIQDFGGAGPWSVDGLSLSFTAVPEPTGTTAVALGLIGLASYRRRNR